MNNQTSKPANQQTVGGPAAGAKPLYPAHQLADVCRVKSLARAVQSPALAVVASPLPPTRLLMPQTALFAETDLDLELDHLKGAEIGPEQLKVSLSGHPRSKMLPK